MNISTIGQELGYEVTQPLDSSLKKDVLRWPVESRMPLLHKFLVKNRCLPNIFYRLLSLPFKNQNFEYVYSTLLSKECIKDADFLANYPFVMTDSMIVICICAGHEKMRVRAISKIQDNFFYNTKEDYNRWITPILECLIGKKYGLNFILWMDINNLLNDDILIVLVNKISRMQHFHFDNGTYVTNTLLSIVIPRWEESTDLPKYKTNIILNLASMNIARTKTKEEYLRSPVAQVFKNNMIEPESLIDGNFKKYVSYQEGSIMDFISTLKDSNKKALCMEMMTEST